MPKGSALRTALAAIAVLSSLRPAAAAVQGPTDVPAVPALSDAIPGRVLVRFRDGASAAARDEALAAVEGRIARTIPRIRYRLVEVPLTVPPDEAVRRLRAHPAVAAAEPNWRVRAALVPNDRCYLGCSGYRQWDLGAVNAQLGWDAAPGRFYTAAEKKELSPVKVAVLDTRIDQTMADWGNATDHPIANPADARNGGQLDLVGARDFVPQEFWSGSMVWHGTFIAGLLGAAANNTTDIAGLGYAAQIVPVTVLDGGGSADAATLAEAIVYSVGTGARVVNLSLGIASNSDAVQQAINAATRAGALVVAAAGNNDNDKPFYPAWMDNVMSVAASDEADRPGSCSNHNARVSVAAPGVDVVSIDPTQPSKLSKRCGTSAAAPHVSALAALLFGQDPSRTPAEVRAIIESTTDDDPIRPGRDDYMGSGRINVERALRWGESAPQMSGVAVTVPPATGGASLVRATAAAAPGRDVRAAEYFLDTPGPAGSGVPLEPGDGAFDERYEDVRVQIPVTVNVPSTGVHRLFVRAFDGSAWGPAVSAAMIVDRTRPRIAELKADPVSVPEAGIATRITFRVTDDWASRLTYSFTVVPKVGSQPVYDSGTRTMAVGDESVEWLPDVTDKGPYEIRLVVRDEAANPASGTAETIVL